MITAISIVLYAIAALILGGTGAQAGTNGPGRGIGLFLFVILFALAAALQVFA